MNLILKRNFSFTTGVFREWRLVETRKVAKQPDYKVGDKKPLYIPRFRKKTPDYPWGESNIFKQSNKGLYGASFIQFGNSISESKTKTRRTWLPNVIKKSLWSEILQQSIRIKLTAKVLKTISKEGGIDNYLLKEKSARIKELGPTGWKLRYKLLTTKLKKENPPHKDAKVVKDSQGNEKILYYEVLHNDNILKITCGRRKLMRLLFQLELKEYKADCKELSYMQFVENYQSFSINALVAKLDQYGFDFKTITL